MCCSNGRRFNGLAILLAAVLTSFTAMAMVKAEKQSAPPTIAGHGKVTPMPDAVAQPRDGAKILVDVTVGGPREEINPGLEKLARFVNIYASAGKSPAHANIVAVLHGDATQLALDDAAYGEAFSTKTNPNVELMRDLQAAGVEFLVCGQALTLKGFQPEQTHDQVTVAVSGLTALVNYQQDGYSYVPLK